MNRARILTVLAVALGVALGGACGGDGDDGGPTQTPGPGTLTVVLAAADNEATAIQFRISGATITNVAAVGGLTIFQRTDGNTVNIALIGAMGDGPVATFDVPDVSGTYTVSVVDVADSQNNLLNKNSYVLSIQN